MAEGLIGAPQANLAAGRVAGLRDAACLLLVCAIGSAAYVGGLGAYSDDWLFLAPLATSPDQSWTGLYRALAGAPYVAVRPGQILWYLVWHELTPGAVLPAHLASHALFAAAALTMHHALRAVPATRHAAWYVVLLYACLPTFSVARMWYANHQAIVALLLFALAWALVVGFAQRAGRGRWFLLPAIMLAAALGNLFYELFAVVALGLPLFVWWSLGARPRALVRDPAFLAASAAVAAGFTASTAFKLTIGYGVALPVSGPQLARFAVQAGSLYAQAATTTFWTLGLWSPRAAVGILGSPHLQPGSLVAPLLVAAVVAARERLARRAPPGQPEAGLGFLALTGLTAWVLGYVPFLTNFLYSAKPWGEANRGNIGAALGAALLIYAGFRWLQRRRPGLAAALLVGFCAVGTFLQVAVGRMWVAATVEQDRMYAAFARVARTGLPDRGTVLLYRTCPYHGAAPVYPYGWDIGGRLAVEAGYRHLTVDVVQPGMQLGPAGMATPAGLWSVRYPYRDLRVVDLGDGSVHPLAGLADAQRLFARRPLARAITCRFEYGMGNPLY